MTITTIIAITGIVIGVLYLQKTSIKLELKVNNEVSSDLVKIDVDNKAVNILFISREDIEIEKLL